jgi:hypothetical protein
MGILVFCKKRIPLPMVPIAGIPSVKLRLSFGQASVKLRLSHAGKSALKSGDVIW